MATVFIPALLRDLTGGAEQVAIEIPAGERISVRELLARLDGRYPGLLEQLTVAGDLLPGIAVFVDSEQAMLGLRTKVGNDSVLHFVPPIVGGR